MNYLETDQFFYFKAEVSNEEMDVEGQIVLQKTLLNAKEYFLKNGVVSVNHRHRKRLPNKQFTRDTRYVVGRPISVYCKGKSTWITGKLDKNNPLARIVIELLRRNSDKVKTSVGGLSPRIAVAPDGKQTVTFLSWDDVALTITPVNSSLQPVRGVQKPINLDGGFDMEEVLLLEKKVKTGNMRKRPLLVHRQFTIPMQKAIKPILVKAVATGELDILECGKIESQINKSLNNPNFQIDQKYLCFITEKLKSGKTLKQSLKA